MSTICLIAAMAQNRVIGFENRLPWRIKAEMQHFKQSTLGKPVIMGRKTFESHPMNKKPLVKRHNIILTRDKDYHADNVTVVHSIDEALQAAGDVDEIMVIGGESLYRCFLPYAQRMLLSVIPQQIEGDAFFPEYDAAEWQQVAEQKHSEFTVKVLEKKP